MAGFRSVTRVPAPPVSIPAVAEPSVQMMTREFRYLLNANYEALSSCKHGGARLSSRSLPVLDLSQEKGDNKIHVGQFS